MNIKDLAVDHPYYCSGDNFYSNEAAQRYNDWGEFMSEWGNADVEYNHVFRFDLKKKDECDGIVEYYAEVFFIIQRKGIFIPCHIDIIQDSDVQSIEEFLKKHWNEVLKMWKPFS